MDGDGMKQVIADYIRGEYLERGQQIDNSTRLISTGIVDSFSMATLKAFLEDQYGISIPDARATADAFDTVDSIAALVSELRSAR